MRGDVLLVCHPVRGAMEEGAAAARLGKKKFFKFLEVFSYFLDFGSDIELFHISYVFYLKKMFSNFFWNFLGLKQYECPRFVLFFDSEDIK